MENIIFERGYSTIPSDHTQTARLVIPKVPPSFNELRGMNRFVYKDLREEWRREVQIAYAECETDVVEPIRVIYVRSYWNDSHRLDIDNLYASFKPIGDALRPKSKKSGGGLVGGENSILSEDNPNIIRDLEAAQQKISKENHPITKINLIEVS